MKLVVNITSYFFQGKFKQLSRFSVIGVANTLIDFMIFTMLHSLFGVNYIVGQAIGYSCGVANSFMFNRRWTFKDRNANKKTFHEFLKFIVVNLISLTITILVINLLVKHFNFNAYVSKIIVTLIAQVTNFLAYKLWIFN